MKQLTAILISLFLGLTIVWGVSAQAAQTIWIETSQQAYNPGDTITVIINAISTTPIQGLSFQLRYDPACLQPATPSSILSGLNYMSVPQTQGLVDAIFASTTPVNANGPLAQVQFTALAACQTSLKLENASLAVMDANQMAVPLGGISLGNSSLTLNSGSAPAVQPTGALGVNPTNTADSNSASSPNLNPTPVSQSTQVKPFNGLIVIFAVALGILFLIGIFIILVLVFQKNRQPSQNISQNLRRSPALFIKRGPQAGATLPLVRFPCRIGSDPDNEICISDSRISALHAEIFADQYGYTLVDMGSQDGTYLNGKIVQGQLNRLRAGDAIRLGGVLLVFGPV